VIDDDGWWNREPEDLRQGCLVVLAGVLLGWAVTGGIIWAILRWWSRG
jgi:hypothetical protein